MPQLLIDIILSTVLELVSEKTENVAWMTDSNSLSPLTVRKSSRQIPGHS